MRRLPLACEAANAKKGDTMTLPRRPNMLLDAHIKAPASLLASPGLSVPTARAPFNLPRHLCNLSGSGTQDKPRSCTCTLRPRIGNGFPHSSLFAATASGPSKARTKRANADMAWLTHSA